MANWNKLSKGAVAADRPYGSDTLRLLADRTEYADEHFGSAHSINFFGKYGDLEEYLGQRPFVSVSGLSCIAAIPWWISPGLTKIKSEFWVRVSNYEIDDTLGEHDPSADIPVELQVRFLRNFGVASIEVLPRVVVASGALWQRVALEYELGEFTGGLRYGFWDYLVLEMRSSVITTLEGDDVDGTIASAGMTNRNSFRVQASGIYTDPGAPAPSPGAQETLCTLISKNRITTPYELGGVVDHVMRNGNNEMVIWPPNPGLLTVHGESAWTSVAAYLQIASWSVQEVFSGAAGIVGSDLWSQNPTYARGISSIASGINEVAQRKELVHAVSTGWEAVSAEGSGWTDRGYYKRWPSTYGSLGSSRVFMAKTCKLRQPTRGITVKGQLAGVYASQTYYEEESFKDTYDKSVSGYVTIRTRIIQDGVTYADETEIKQITFTISNKLSTSKFLYSAAWLHGSPSTSGDPEMLVYTEGTLRLQGPQQTTATARVGGRVDLDDDAAVLTDGESNLEVELVPSAGFDWRRPFDTRVDVEITDGPSGQKASFKKVEMASLLPKAGDLEPLPLVMHCYLVAEAVWSDPAPIRTAPEGITQRDLILASQPRAILDAQTHARHTWGQCASINTQAYVVDSLTPTQDDPFGPRGLERFDLVFAPIRPEVEALVGTDPTTNHILELRAKCGEDAVLYAYLYEVSDDATSTTPDLVITATQDGDGYLVGREVIPLKSSPPDEILSYHVRFFAEGEGDIIDITLEEVIPAEPTEGTTVEAEGDLYVARAADGVSVESWRNFDAFSVLSGLGDLVRDVFGPRLNAVDFDGTTDGFIAAPVSCGSPVVFAAAFSADVNDSTERDILYFLAGGVKKFRLFHRSLTGLRVSSTASGFTSEATVQSISTATWYDVVVSFDDGVRRVWVNGVLRQQASVGIDSGDGALYVGSYLASFDGKIGLPAMIKGLDYRDAERYVARRMQLLGLT